MKSNDENNKKYFPPENQRPCKLELPNNSSFGQIGGITSREEGISTMTRKENHMFLQSTRDGCVCKV